jgi:hypothetical protein
MRDYNMKKNKTLDELISDFIMHKKFKNIILKWNTKNKLAALGILSNQFSNTSEQIKKYSDACLLVANLLDVNLHEIENKLMKIIENLEI